MPSRESSPTLDELQAYGLGKLGPDRAAEIEFFLADHPECGSVLASAPDDAVVRHLRGAGDLDDTGLPPSAADLAAALVGHPRYRLLRKLGEGGMGLVFLAEHRLMRRPVALKVIRAHCLSRPQAVERFRREVQAAAGLNHPNIVTAHDAEEAGGTHFLVMEYVEGVSLDRWLAEHGPLPAAEACSYVRQAALGLQYAHEKGLVHRDLKPHNLMRLPDGTVKVLDFGLARLAAEPDDAGSLTAPGTVMGTADYMAPEQGQDSRTADIRADVYSLGCTLYQLLTGRLPYPEGTIVQKIFKHSLERPRPLAGLRPDLPAGLVRVVETMMARRPAERYQTPAKVADALEPFTRPKDKGQRTKLARTLAFVLCPLAFALALLAAGVVYHLRTGGGEVVTGRVAGPAPAGGAEAAPKVTLFRTFIFPAGSFADQFHFSADNSRLIGSGFRRGAPAVYVWEVETGNLLYTGTGFPRKVWHNARLLFGGKEFLLLADNTLSRWDVASGKKVADYPPVPDGFDGASLQLSPDGKRFAMFCPGHVEKAEGVDATLGSRIYVRELSSEEPFRIEPEHPRSILCGFPRFSPDGSRLVTCDSSITRGSLRVWDAATGRAVAHIAADVAFGGYVSWSADGRCLIADCGDMKTKRSELGVWDVATGRQVGATAYGLSRDDADKVVVPRGGRVFATAHLRGGRLTVWDGKTGNEVENLSVPGLTIYSPTSSPDGTLLAAGNRQEVRLYRLPDPEKP